MKKTKIYLDTSVISHLEQPEKPIEQALSRELFRKIKGGVFTAYISGVVFEEVADCKPAKKDALLLHISEINFVESIINDEVKWLAKKIIEQKVLPPSSVNDSQHIAAAIIAGCDYVISWNMKHMANVRVNKGIRHITLDEGHKEIMLVPPSMLLEGGNYNDSQS